MPGAQFSPMRTALACLCFGILVFASPAQSEETTGRIRAVYYEAARGVLVDAKMLYRASATRWADVDVQGRRMLVQMPVEMMAGVGDLVAVRLGEPKSSQLAQILPTVTVSRAIEIEPGSPQFAGSATSGAASSGSSSPK
jgi:hypothetical protein